MRALKITLTPPLKDFSKEIDLGHKVNLLLILCGHFDEKKMGDHWTIWGRVSRQSQMVKGVVETFFHFFDILSRNFEQYLHSMKLKLTEHV